MILTDGYTVQNQEERIDAVVIDKRLTPRAMASADHALAKASKTLSTANVVCLRSYARENSSDRLVSVDKREYVETHARILSSVCGQREISALAFSFD
jgi:hypothetical protein